LFERLEQEKGAARRESLRKEARKYRGKDSKRKKKRLMPVWWFHRIIHVTVFTGGKKRRRILCSNVIVQKDEGFTIKGVRRGREEKGRVNFSLT